MDGRDWLAQAATGGLPEPTRQRWQPLRVGIVNLWEYEAAEFWFADGRLVLRGGNGAGKTKILELTTLMLLRGEITPSVLDPFGSQHRTMRYNLLPTGDADDPRPPADAGLGYAWVEFGRRDDTGHAHFYVCGLGASARRGTGTGSVSPWQFITALRPGKDVQLSRAGRPVDHSELKKVSGVSVLENARRYRARLAAELFALDSSSYDSLTEMLKQLRKPKLGERLNPATLAEMLRDALPPLATNEVEQLADGWDRLEKLRLAVEATKEAAKQVAGFVRSAWLPWARIVVRQRADTFAAARTSLDDTTREKAAAAARLESARAAVTDLTGQLRAARDDHAVSMAELRELLESRPYQDAVTAANRVESLKRDLAAWRRSLTDAKGDAATKREELDRRKNAASTAAEQAARASKAVAERAAPLDEAADPAGLVGSTERHLPGCDVVALRAHLLRRVERFARLRALHDSYDQAHRVTELSAQTVSERQEDDERSRVGERTAQQGVESAVDALRHQIREWAAATTVVDCPADLVEHWCDQVAELTTPGSTTSVAREVSTHAEVTRERLRTHRVDLIRTRDPLGTELRDVNATLTEVRNREDLPPPEPTLWRRAERPGTDAGMGAPLWRCVQPRDNVSGADLDLLEAALAASDLLDAWLSPDGRLRTEDGKVVADTTVDIRSTRLDETLATVLEPTPVGGVDGDTITALLRGIGWHESLPAAADGAWLAADGTWQLGVLAGRAKPSRPASFLGATARAEARRREIAALETRVSSLTEQIDEITDAIDDIDRQMSTVDDESARIPREQPLTNAVATWDERRKQRQNSASRLATAETRHQDNERQRDTAWAEFSTYAGEHRFPLHDLNGVASALDTFRDALSRFELAVTEANHRTETAERAEEARQYQADLLTEATAKVESLTGEVRTAEVRVRTAEHALSTDHAGQLARKEQLDQAVTELDATIERLGDELSDAKVTAATAERTLETHEGRRAEAEQERDRALAAWWEIYDAGLARAVGLDELERRVVETGRTAVAEARRDLAEVADEHAEPRSLRRCTERLHELKQQLLPNRDARVNDETDTGGIPRFGVLAHSDTGWQLPHDAADALAEQVHEQEESFDAEQQKVLATLLGSTFIEHLKDRLDYTERTFAGINTRLADHATRHGHAVRLTHEPDPADPDSHAVVTALNQGYQQLSPERQDMVRSFLVRKIDEAQAEATADHVTDWQEQLSVALDYRRWLRISLDYRPGVQARWRPFDRAQHGAKSGGEKVVLLSQPLFAATVVAYDAASEQAPRWVWLDEAMTGVDGPYKASFMGLTVDFNLDVMLTAHDEWCTYSTVPAVAVYDLARQPHLPGVDAQPHLWCGGELTQVEMGGTDDTAALGGMFIDPGDEP